MNVSRVCSEGRLVGRGEALMVSVCDFSPAAPKEGRASC